MKKFIAVLLALFTLFSCFSVLSFAEIRTVPAPENLAFSEDGIASWNKVEGAAGYIVELFLWTYDTASKKVRWVSVGEYDIQGANAADFSPLMLTGKYKFSVKSYLSYSVVEGSPVVTWYSQPTVLEDEKAVKFTKTINTEPIETLHYEDSLEDGETKSFLKKLLTILKAIINFLLFAGNKSGITDSIRN